MAKSSYGQSRLWWHHKINLKKHNNVMIGLAFHACWQNNWIFAFMTMAGCAILPMMPLCCGKLSVSFPRRRSKRKIMETSAEWQINKLLWTWQVWLVHYWWLLWSLVFLTLINFCGFIMIANKEIRMSWLIITWLP